MASNEHSTSLVRPTKSQEGGEEMGTRQFGAEKRRNGRKALSVINQNTVGASKPYPCAVNKRAIRDSECVVYDENLPNPQKRPITRQFASQLQKAKQQQQHSLAEIKKQDSPIQISNQIEKCRITDVEEENKQTITVFSDQNEMEEVEMEDIFEEPVIDIDSRDTRNHLAVVEYVRDLYAYYRKMEGGSCVSPDYMSQQSDINEKMRAILIDWLIEVHNKFELRDETLFLTVNLIDRFLAKQSVVRKKLQLVGLVAMLLACKYEEVLVPVVDDLIFISDKAYTRKELLEMEKLMLNTLQFNMSLPTPYVFLTRFLKAAEANTKLKLLSFFLIELSLVEYKMLRFPPSLLAAAAVYTAQCCISGLKQWSKTCEWYSTYKEDHLIECSRLMVEFHQKVGTAKLTGVQRKYSTSKFGYAADCEAALFLLIK